VASVGGDRRRGSRGRFYAYLLVSLLILLFGGGALSGAAGWMGARFVDLVVGEPEDPRTARLREAVTALSLENARLREAALKSERYRRMLGITRTASRETVAGRVLYRSEGIVAGMELVLDRGERDGVTEGAVCITPEGLVGVVDRVDEATCVALPITNPAVQVAAAVYPSGAMGIVRSDARGRMDMVHVDISADVSTGDRVYTVSAGGTIYPAGILVGSVAGLEEGQPGLEKRLRLSPAVDIQAVEEVIVLLAPPGLPQG
jgi:rod shape-determining protein MreC